MQPRSVFGVLLEKSKHDVDERTSVPELESESSLLVMAGTSKVERRIVY